MDTETNCSTERFYIDKAIFNKYDIPTGHYGKYWVETGSTFHGDSCGDYIDIRVDETDCGVLVATYEENGTGGNRKWNATVFDAVEMASLDRLLGENSALVEARKEEERLLLFFMEKITAFFSGNTVQKILVGDIGVEVDHPFQDSPHDDLERIILKKRGEVFMVGSLLIYPHKKRVSRFWESGERGEVLEILQNATFARDQSA